MRDEDWNAWAVGCAIHLFLGAVLLMTLPPDFRIAAWVMIGAGVFFGNMAIRRRGTRPEE